MLLPHAVAPEMTQPHYVIDLSEIYRQAETDFHAARALALETYSELEHALAFLFSILSRTDDRTASAIFFRIGNTRARTTILEKLSKNSLDANLRVFFDFMIGALPRLDQERNKIVHWFTRYEETDDGFGKVLAPAIIFAHTTPHEIITRADMVKFAHECAFLARALSTFCMTIRSAELLPTALTDLFNGDPWTYPVPESHPLFRKISP